MTHRHCWPRLGLTLLPLAVLALAVGSLLASAWTSTQPGDAPPTLTPADAVARAWNNARQAGSYRLTSDVQQTLVPRPLPRNVGKGDTQSALHVEGDVIVPDRARLTLAIGGAPSSALSTQHSALSTQHS